MSSEAYHEPVELLPEPIRNLHRGIVSLVEELEAIDWYGQRLQACTDEALKEILAHNRNEEIEHAAMVLNWIRQQDSGFDDQLRAKLFADNPLAEEGTKMPAAEGTGGGGGGSLGIGSLRRGS